MKNSPRGCSGGHLWGGEGGRKGIKMEAKKTVVKMTERKTAWGDLKEVGHTKNKGLNREVKKRTRSTKKALR